MNVTMQCLTCGATRGTMQKIKHPARRLRCAGCEQVTRHRAMADPVQGDWREDQNLSLSAAAAQTVAEPPAIPAGVQVTLDLAGVVPVFVPNLDGEAWLESVVKVIDGRALLLIRAGIDRERLADLACQALARKRATGEDRAQ